MEKLILASASPRRKELLARMNIPFDCESADVDENVEGLVEKVAPLLAVRKAEAVFSKNPNAAVIGADTLVYARGEILGKPRDEADAMRMLRILAGNWHSVYTGVAVVSNERKNAAVERTRVHFTAMTEREIKEYIATGDSMDKAGAYGVQGYAGQFVDRIEGCYYNVMGLPLALLRKMLKTAKIL